MTVHELKTNQEFFRKIWEKQKSFEIRRNDRNFNIGDLVVLREFLRGCKFTGFWILAKIEYITDFEQQTGFVVFSFTEFARGRDHQYTWRSPRVDEKLQPEEREERP